jgi:hypothetical protein
MKKILLTAVVGLALTSTTNAQIAFGPELGLNISDLVQTTGNGYNRGYTYTYTPKAGIKVGGLVEIPLNRNFYLQPGLFFSTKGASDNDPNHNNATTTLDINYIELPVNILYKFGRPSGNRFFLGAGLAVGTAVGGHIAANGHTDKIYIGNDPQVDAVRAFDVGISGQLGYQLSSGFIFRLQSVAGVTNITPGGNADYGLYNYTTTISVAYLFGVQRNHVDRKKKIGVRTDKY